MRFGALAKEIMVRIEYFIRGFRALDRCIIMSDVALKECRAETHPQAILRPNVYPCFYEGVYGVLRLQ